MAVNVGHSKGRIPPSVSRRAGVTSLTRDTQGPKFHHAATVPEPRVFGHEELPAAAVPEGDGVVAVTPAARAALLTAPATAPATLSLKTLGMM
jgi:hypothetical protein